MKLYINNIWANKYVNQNLHFSELLNAISMQKWSRRIMPRFNNLIFLIKQLP